MSDKATPARALTLEFGAHEYGRTHAIHRSPKRFMERKIVAARFHLRASRARLRCRFRNVQRPRRYENVRVGEAITVDDESGFRGERRATVVDVEQKVNRK